MQDKNFKVVEFLAWRELEWWMTLGPYAAVTVKKMLSANFLCINPNAATMSLGCLAVPLIHIPLYSWLTVPLWYWMQLLGTHVSTVTPLNSFSLFSSEKHHKLHCQSHFFIILVNMYHMYNIHQKVWTTTNLTVVSSKCAISGFWPTYEDSGLLMQPWQWGTCMCILLTSLD